MASGSVTQAQSPLSYKDVSLLVVSEVQKTEKVKKETYLQNVLNVSENFGPDSDCVYSFFSAIRTGQRIWLPGFYLRPARKRWDICLKFAKSQ